MIEAYMNIICKKESIILVESRVLNFLRRNSVNVYENEKKEYWKCNECVQVSMKFSLFEINIDMIKKELINFWDGQTKINCIHASESVEFNLYATLQEILNENKVFLTLFMNLNHTVDL